MWCQSDLLWIIYFHRQFTADDRYAQLPLNVSAAGDITLIFYHARSTFGGKIQGKVSVETVTDNKIVSLNWILADGTLT